MGAECMLEGEVWWKVRECLAETAESGPVAAEKAASEGGTFWGGSDVLGEAVDKAAGKNSKSSWKPTLSELHL